MAETKKDALMAFDAFVENWGIKYDKAVECLIKDRDALLAFYDFPAEHWKHLRFESDRRIKELPDKRVLNDQTGLRDSCFCIDYGTLIRTLVWSCLCVGVAYASNRKCLKTRRVYCNNTFARRGPRCIRGIAPGTYRRTGTGRRPRRGYRFNYRTSIVAQEKSVDLPTRGPCPHSTRRN